MSWENMGEISSSSGIVYQPVEMDLNPTYYWGATASSASMKIFPLSRHLAKVRITFNNLKFSNSPSEKIYFNAQPVFSDFLQMIDINPNLASTTYFNSYTYSYFPSSIYQFLFTINYNLTSGTTNIVVGPIGRNELNPGNNTIQAQKYEISHLFVFFSG